VVEQRLATPLAVFYVLLWASAYVPSKIGATAMPPLWFLVGRFLTAGALMADRLQFEATVSRAT
jgi:drug/metabolite transporter (DMT)-like permease